MLLDAIIKKIVRFEVLTALAESEDCCLCRWVGGGYICHDNGGSKYFCKVGTLVPDYMVWHLRRQQSLLRLWCNSRYLLEELLPANGILTVCWLFCPNCKIWTKKSFRYMKLIKSKFCLRNWLNWETDITQVIRHCMETIWHSEDRASWYILIIKPKRCTNFSNLFLE